MAKYFPQHSQKHFGSRGTFKCVTWAHLGVPVPGPFSVEVLAAGVARKRRLEAVDLGHVRQQHPLGHKLCPALFTDDRLLQCPLLSVQVRSAKNISKLLISGVNIRLQIWMCEKKKSQDLWQGRI